MTATKKGLPVATVLQSAEDMLQEAQRMLLEHQSPNATWFMGVVSGARMDVARVRRELEREAADAHE